MVIICTTSFWEEENILFSLLLHFMLLKFCGKKKKEIEFIDTFKRLSDQSKGVERGIVEDVKRSKGNDG